MENASEYFSKYLADEGYRPSVDDDGDVVFKVEGELFMIRRDQEDPSYLRIMLGYDRPTSAELAAAIAVANDLNGKYKAVKVSVDPDDGSVWFSFEAFYTRPEHAAPCIRRVLHSLVAASNELFAELRASATD